MFSPLKNKPESSLCLPTTPMCGVCPSMWSVYCVTSLRKIALCLKQVATANSSLTRVGISCSPYTPHADGTLFCLILSRSCECCQSLWVHMNTCPAVSNRNCFLGVIDNFWLLNTPCLLLYKDPWAWWVLYRHPIQGWALQGCLFSEHWLVVCFCVKSLILKKRSFFDGSWVVQWTIGIVICH